MTITNATYPIVRWWRVNGLCYSQSSLNRLLVTDCYIQYTLSRKLHWNTFDRDNNIAKNELIQILAFSSFKIQ